MLLERDLPLCIKRSMPRSRFAALVALFLLCSLSLPQPALLAQSAPDPEKLALEQRVEKLEKALAAVQAQLVAIQGAGQPASTAASVAAQNAPTAAAPQVAQQHPAPATVPGSATPSSSGVFPEAVALQTLGENQPTTAELHEHKFFERKPGRDLTFYTHGGEITPYGNLDLSFDAFSKGIGNLLDGNGAGPVGNVGWMPDISTNLSYIGIRGFQATGIKNLTYP